MAFPLAKISEIAKRESWRKEINRPIYHLHKWWAQRLGSVFRASVIHSFATQEDEWALFYQEHSFNKLVLDPFMGSGTTLGEALKLGCSVIGCDINPVSTFLVTEELRYVPRQDLDSEFKALELKVANSIASYHMTIDPETGEEIPVLYYFWVMTVKTPQGERIPLFENYFFSHNAYPTKVPEAQILCPRCGGVFEGKYKETSSSCPHCGLTFDANSGPATKTTVTDSQGRVYKIKDLINVETPPDERPYALLAVRNNGEKVYLPFSEYDKKLYSKAVDDLQHCNYPIPDLAIDPGYNADQARAYGFTRWADLFNPREALCLGMLLSAILEIESPGIRNQFLCLFNGTLEFNNRFCSYKGEGTGAIRPIFSNHILKPERRPVENSVWGIKQSSGCFSSLYRTRLLKAKDYLEKPFELRLSPDGKVSKPVCSSPIHPRIVSSFEEINDAEPCALILNGDSANLPIPDASIDSVITDPPYFDFINYSELSDFFYAWLRVALPNCPLFEKDNSRRPGEVQNADKVEFSDRLTRVFAECVRVMKDDATLTFSFHHSKQDGWKSIERAIQQSGLSVIEVEPVYAELSASTPKAATKEPISIDMMIVCAKQRRELTVNIEDLITEAIDTLNKQGHSLSQSDYFVLQSGFNLLRNAR